MLHNDNVTAANAYFLITIGPRLLIRVGLGFELGFLMLGLELGLEFGLSLRLGLRLALRFSYSKGTGT